MSSYNMGSVPDPQISACWSGLCRENKIEETKYIRKLRQFTNLKKLVLTGLITFLPLYNFKCSFNHVYRSSWFSIYCLLPEIL